MRYALVFTCALAGCAATEYPPVVIGADACGAATAQDLIGAPAEGQTYPAQADPVRILGPDDVATTDYIPTRLTVLTDAQGRIASLTCG